MVPSWLLTTAVAATATAALAQQPATGEHQGDAGRDQGAHAPEADLTWWRDARLGMFIHWGLYSEAAGRWNGSDIPGWGEWLLNKIKVDPEVYAATLMPAFNPVLFDADAWVRTAKSAGMEYLVITTKHHDGFLLWDSATTGRDLANTPMGREGRDPLRELAAACAREGVRFGVYFSLMDWSDPDYLPRREWDTRPVDAGSMDRFVPRMHAQVMELMDGRFGPIAVLWGDGDWEHGPAEWRTPGLLARVREAQPGILVNDRWSLPGDYATPENRIPDAGLPHRPWETCMTMNGTWGYVVHDHRWKSPSELIRNLVDIVSKDGNYLLNVGPKGDGAFDEPTQERLHALGAWMQVHGSAIHGCGAIGLPRPAWGRLTGSADRTRVNAIVFDCPPGRSLSIEGLAAVPARARVLGAPSIAIATAVEGPVLTITLGEGALEKGALDQAAAVIELEWDGPAPVVGTPVLLHGDDLFLHETDIAFAPTAAGSVHVTLDGTEPTCASPAYDHPINVQATTRVRARTFVDGIAAGAPFDATMRRAVWLEGQDHAPSQPGVRWSLVPGTHERVPADAAWNDPHATHGVLASVGLPDARPADAFAVRLDGMLHCSTAGLCTFVLESDDGSTLEIDGTLVIDHDGLHGPTKALGRAALAEGWHRITIRFIEHSGGESLSLHWLPPGMPPDAAPVQIDPSLLRHEP